MSVWIRWSTPCGVDSVILSGYGSSNQADNMGRRTSRFLPTSASACTAKVLMSSKTWLDDFQVNVLEELFGVFALLLFFVKSCCWALHIWHLKIAVCKCRMSSRIFCDFGCRIGRFTFKRFTHNFAFSALVHPLWGLFSRLRPPKVLMNPIEKRISPSTCWLQSKSNKSFAGQRSRNRRADWKWLKFMKVF